MSTHNRLGVALLSAVTAVVLLGFLTGPTAQAELVAHYTFNEVSGDTVFDQTGNGHHGQIFGGATRVDTPGLRGIQLDGIDDYVNFFQPDIFDVTDGGMAALVIVGIEKDQTGADLDNFGIFGKSGNSWLIGYEHGNRGRRARHNGQMSSADEMRTATSTFAQAKIPSWGSFHSVMISNGCCSNQLQLTTDAGLHVYEGGVLGSLLSESVDVVAGRLGDNFLTATIDEIMFFDERLTVGEQARETIRPASTEPSLSPGFMASDFNLDGAVDIEDFGIFAGFFGSPNSVADLNDDNIVDIEDFGIFAGEFGQLSSGSAPVQFPEPSTMGTLLVLGGLLRRRSRRS